jgi:hypothetical protein
VKWRFFANYGNTVYTAESTAHALRWHLATMGAVKYAPHRKILGNLLDLVLDSRSHEQKVA